MNRKFAIYGVLAVIICLGILVVSSSLKGDNKETVASNTPADEEVMVIKLGHGSASSADDPYHYFATQFAKYVDEGTNSKVKIEIYPGGQLGGEMDSYEGLGHGTVDMCIATANIFAEYYPKTQIMDLPFLFNDLNAAYTLLDSDLMTRLLDELGEKTGAVHLAWGSGGFRNIFNNVRPVYVTDDLKGVKIRVPETTIFVDTFKALGANVTPMTYSECYTAISQGTIDGIEVPIGNGYTVGFYEVCKYYSLSGHFYNAYSMSISKALFDKLTPEVQNVLRTAAKKAGDEQRKFVEETMDKQLETMKEAGLQVNDIKNKDEWRAKCQSIYDNYKNNIDADVYTEAMEILGIK